MIPYLILPIEERNASLCSYFLHSPPICSLYGHCQNGCNTFFQWVLEYNLLIKRLVFIYGSISKNQSLDEQTIFQNSLKKKCCNRSDHDCTSLVIENFYFYLRTYHSFAVIFTLLRNLIQSITYQCTI